MKLLYITVSMPFGSGEEFFIPEVQEFLRQGHEVLIVPRSPAGELMHCEALELESRTLACRLYSWGIVFASARECLVHPIRSWKTMRFLFSSRDWVTFARNLAVFPKGLWIGGLARRWRANHIHAQWASTTATMAMVAGEMSRTPWSFTAHRGDIVQNNLLTVKVAKASFVRYISKNGILIAESLGVKDSGRKAVVIHMGVRLPDAISPALARERVPTALCAANLLPVKGHRYLLEALEILEARGGACRLILAGHGELEDELRGLVERLSLHDTVQFMGHVLHEDVLKLYREQSVDLAVLASVDLGNHEHEGIPVFLMEAMAHGIPVISTETGGIPELLREGAGIMVPPQDPEALAEAIERLIRDPALRAQVGIEGRRRIEEQFAVGRTVSELTALIEATGSDARAGVA